VAPGALLIDELRDLRQFQPSTPERLRRFDIASPPSLELRAIPPKSPFGLPKAQAAAAGLVCTSGEPHVFGLSDPNAAEVSLALAGSWVFVATRVIERAEDGQPAEVDGTLRAFFGPGDRVGQASRTRDAVSHRLPAAFSRLQRAFPAEPRTPPDSERVWPRASEGDKSERAPWSDSGEMSGTTTVISDAPFASTDRGPDGLTALQDRPASAAPVADQASSTEPDVPPSDDDPPWAT
jgi:hypothetical protein